MYLFCKNSLSKIEKRKTHIETNIKTPGTELNVSRTKFTWIWKWKQMFDRNNSSEQHWLEQSHSRSARNEPTIWVWKNNKIKNRKTKNYKHIAGDVCVLLVLFRCSQANRFKYDRKWFVILCAILQQHTHYAVHFACKREDDELKWKTTIAIPHKSTSHINVITL